MRRLVLFAVVLALVACDEDEAPTETSVRGLKTHLIERTERSTLRRYPAVLEPTALTALSFDIGGRLSAVTLQVGQTVRAGEVLAALDPESLDLQVAARQAELGIAAENDARAQDTLLRQRQLFERGTITRTALDAAETEAQNRARELERARIALASAEADRAKSTLRAPFDGIVNSVEVQSFATVSAGAPIVSLYSADAFQVAFSVNFDTATQLVVGTPATVRLADRPDITLPAVVSELGSRADAVSSFPVVLTLQRGDPILKAGMAVEAAIELPLPAAEGFTLPLTAIIKEGAIEGRANEGPGRAQVYVHDPATSTVVRREITIAGIRENAIIVIDGLSAGERVAAAGVSFLRDGQEVRLLDEE